MRRRNGFTLIEVLVVISIIVILMAITIAVAQEVRQNSEVNLTKATLKDLQDGLSAYRGKTHQVPPNMAAFLTDYQDLYAYPGGIRPNILSKIPQELIVAGPITTPYGTPQGVAGVNDGFGDAIIYVPTGANAPYFESGGPPAAPAAGTSVPSYPDPIYSYSP